MIRKTLMGKFPIWMFLCKTVRMISIHIYAHNYLLLWDICSYNCNPIPFLHLSNLGSTKRRHRCDDLYWYQSVIRIRDTHHVTVYLFVYQTQRTKFCISVFTSFSLHMAENAIIGSHIHE